MPRLPALQLQDIQVPEVRHVGLLSPVVWCVEAPELPGQPLYRPLPVRDLSSLLRDSLSRTLESYGFSLSRRGDPPSLSLIVAVDRLLLTSRDGIEGSRACRLDLRFLLQKNPGGQTIESFQTQAEQKLDGSWTIIQGTEPVWAPRPGEANPIDQAARVATESFLTQSLPFWRDSRHWSSALNLSARNAGAGLSLPESR
jgi:hypothetical protein